MKTIILVMMLGVGLSAQEPSNDIATLKAQVSNLESQLQALGSQIQALINRFNNQPVTKEMQRQQLKTYQDICHSRGLWLKGIDIDAKTGDVKIICTVQ